jgi:hypothetical protein
MDERSDCEALCAEVGLDPEMVCCAQCHEDATAGDLDLMHEHLVDGRVVSVCCTMAGELIDRGLVGE